MNTSLMLKHNTSPSSVPEPATADLWWIFSYFLLYSVWALKSLGILKYSVFSSYPKRLHSLCGSCVWVQFGIRAPWWGGTCVYCCQIRFRDYKQSLSPASSQTLGFLLDVSRYELLCCLKVIVLYLVGGMMTDEQEAVSVLTFFVCGRFNHTAIDPVGTNKTVTKWVNIIWLRLSICSKYVMIQRISVTKLHKNW